MKVWMNNKIIHVAERELTEAELAAIAEAQVKAELAERTRPRTVEEGLIALNRAILAEKLAATEDKTLAIACMALFEPWAPGKYEVGDIRTNPTTGYPRECRIAHDSTVNTDWTIDVPTVWKAYHSRSKEYALPFEVSGGHDIYRSGEYMVWTDGKVYLCKSDTTYSPADYAAAWEAT